MFHKLCLGGLLAIAHPATAQDMLLICDGSMRGMFKDRSVGGIVQDNKGNTASGRGSSSQYSDIPTTALFQLENGEAQLNLPQPPTCSICVGEKGWREVRELEVGEQIISGKIRYGLFSGARFQIDRRTGIMTSSNGFQGACEATDLSVRKF